MRRRRHRAPSNLPPIHVWREEIDRLWTAVIAHSETVSYGGYYAASTFLLMLTSEAEYGYRCRQAAEQHFRMHLADHHGGQLPYVRQAFAPPAEEGFP